MTNDKLTQATIDAISSGIKWESLISNVQPLIEDGYEITISKSAEPEYEGALVYRITVTDGGRLVAEADSPELTEAMAEAYSSTPEKTTET